MKNVTYIVADINKSLAFEWIADALDREQFTLSFILINQKGSHLEGFLADRKIEHTVLAPVDKMRTPKLVWKIMKVLKEYESDVIHTHLPAANLAGLLAGRLLNIPKRIYTRHFSSFHHEYFPKAVKYDRFNNRNATHIVAITSVVEEILIHKERVDASKIRMIHHGFNLDQFYPENITDNLKPKYNLEGKGPVIGVIARQVNWKGIQHIIPAFKTLLKEFPNAHLILANAKGPYKGKVDDLIADIADHVTEIPFENNLGALYQCFDVYVHTPINHEIEAFGQTYVEALAAEKPAVFTISGIANDFIKHELNALVVDHRNSEQIADAIKRLLGSPELVKTLTQNGRKDIARFDLAPFIQHLTDLYNE